MGSERSQSVVEFVLVLPIFLVLVMGIIDFGMGFGAYVQLRNAASPPPAWRLAGRSWRRPRRQRRRRPPSTSRR
jgi:hypothetical protein